MAADEAWEFQVTTPAGTPKAAPLVTPTVFPQRRVDEIRWMVPPGPSGLAGWRITMGGVQVIPANAGGWIVRDGHFAGTQLAALPTSGGWDVTGYNTGKYPHTIYVTFLVSILTPPPRLTVPLGLDLLQPGIEAPLAHPPHKRPLWRS